jgi:ribosomal protein L23
MKKVVLIFTILVALAMALLYLSNPGTDISTTFDQVASEDVKHLRKQSTAFLEDLQFKDFDKAETYHSAEDRKKADIANLIERLFAVKPEFLDILRYEIKRVDIDSSGDRAKVKTQTVVKVLNTNEIKEPEIILYWRKDPKEGWVMKLESSLH